MRIGKAFLGLFYGLLYMPILVMVFFSFNHSLHSLVWRGFTWHWYTVLWQDADLLAVTLNSVCLGVASAAITALLALLTTFVVHRYRFFGRAFVKQSILLLLILPDLLLAVALLIGFHMLGLHFGFTTLLLAHIAFSLPFACMILFARWQQEDPHLIEAAQDLGASEWQLFWRIVAPRLLPTVLTVLMLAFTLSFDDVVISFFVSGPSFNILPLHILAQARVGASPEINALCSVLLLLTVLVVLLSQRRFRRSVCDHSV